MPSFTITIATAAEAQLVAEALAAKFGIPPTVAGVKAYVQDHLQKIVKEYKKEQREKAAATEDPDLNIT